MSVTISKARMLAANMGILAIGEMVAKVCTMAAFVLLARRLAPAAYGQVEFALAVTFVAALVIDFGLGLYGSREVSKSPGDIPVITRQVVTARLWLTAMALALVGALTLALHKPFEVKVLLLLFALSLLPAPLLLQWVFQGLDRMHYASTAQVIRYVTFAVAIVIAIHLGTGTWRVALCELLGVAAAAAFLLAAYRRRFGNLRIMEAALPHGQVMRQCLPMGASLFMWAVKYSFMTVLLGMSFHGIRPIATDEQLGNFGAALRIIVALHTFVALYIQNLLPTVSRTWKTSPQMLEPLLGGAIRISTWASLGMCMAATIAAPALIGALYGPKYGGAVVVFQIQVWMLATALLSAHYRVALLAAGRQDLELLSTAAGGVLSIALIVGMYGRLGLAATAAAMLLGEVLTLALSCSLVESKLSRLRLWKLIWAPAIATAAAGAVGVTDQPMWLRLAVCLVVFVIALLLLDRKSLGGLSAVLAGPKGPPAAAAPLGELLEPARHNRCS